MGTPDGMCRPRTLHRRPEEKRWEDVLSFVVGLPWKLSKAHDGDAKVFLDGNPQLPSSDPEVSPLPPIVTEEPVKKIRGSMYTPETSTRPCKALVSLQIARDVKPLSMARDR